MAARPLRARGEEMRLFRRNEADAWWCDLWHQGRRIRKSTGTIDRREAQEYADRLKAELWRHARLGERPTVTWDAAVLDWLDAHTHLRTLSDRKDQLRFASKWLKGKSLAAIDRDTLDVVGKKKAATGVGPATVNRHLAAISAVLGHAFKKGWLPSKPSIPKRHETEKRIRWATQAQARKLITALPRHLAAMAEFSLATGLRQSNVTHLEWSQVDLRRRRACAGCFHTVAAPLSSQHRWHGSMRAKRRDLPTFIGTIYVTHGRAGTYKTVPLSQCCRNSAAGAT